MKYFLSLFLFSIPFYIYAQSNIDVLNYRYQIELNDKNDTIKAIAGISFCAKEDLISFSFDLSAINKDQKGMLVMKVYFTDQDSVSPEFKQENDKIIIHCHQPIQNGDTTSIFISYKGIPSDGLIISKNKFGHRTFFSDNWPDRAHNWIPCVDNPADKASVEFIVTVPDHYKVVSNGMLKEEKELPGNKKITHWKEDVPLPTKVMVIGVADFAVDTAGIVYDIPVTSWVFPENKKEGFYDYAPATDILAFFINYIGPYPYKKLANVQSKTIYGGMENASVIFYYEYSVTGHREEESLLAHEIAHQWFGDMVTEKRFSDLWLSEGFATYLSHIFLESKYGRDKLNKDMIEDRQQVIDFAGTSDRSAVDSISPYKSLLNANSYQKGGWVLHMLRRQLGDSVFHKIIRNYYTAYAGKNADTKDFQKIGEQTSGKDLSSFFQQWLFTPGIPKLEVKWKYNVKNKNLLLKVTQVQKNIFAFPLDIQVKTASGKPQSTTISITRQSQQFSIPLKGKPVKINLDPETSLLFEGTVSSIN